MPRGRKKSHKGGHRHFSNEDDMQMEAEKLRKEQEWRKMKGIESDDDEEEEEEGEEVGAKAAVKKPPKATRPATGQPGELPPSDSEEGSDEDDDDEPDKPKGVSHLIEIENPNRVKAKAKKVQDLGTEESAPQLSRREREELEKQAAKERYEKMHAAGKTDEARADLARLALIRKQREEAAKKREEERLAQEDALKKQQEKKKGTVS